MILIVDDEKYVTELMKRKLTAKGLPIVTANTVSEAKTLIEQLGDIQIVLMDLHLPFEDGYALADWLKSYHPRIKRIAVTAHSHEVVRSNESLFEMVVQKPVDIDTALYDLLLRLITGSK